MPEVVSLDVDRELAKRRGRRVADVVLHPHGLFARASVPGAGPRRQLLRLDSRAAVGNLHRHHDESSLDPSPVDDEGRLQSHIEAQLHDHAIRLRPPLDHLVAACRRNQFRGAAATG